MKRGGGRWEAGAARTQGDGGTAEETTRARKTEERKEEGRDSGCRRGVDQICSKADEAAAPVQTSLLSDATIENNYDVR